MKINGNGSRRKRGNNGVAIVESVLAALAILVPILFLGLDLSVLVVSSSLNEHVAKDAARAAASQTEANQAKSAADLRLKGVRRSELVPEIQMTSFDYVPGSFVKVETRVKVKMPAPFPFFQEARLVAQSTAPIVSTPADL